MVIRRSWGNNQGSGREKDKMRKKKSKKINDTGKVEHPGGNSQEIDNCKGW